MARRNGKKIKGAYSYLAERIAKIAVQFQEVRKVSPGILQTDVSGGNPRVKFNTTPRGLYLTVYQPRSIQRLRICCEDTAVEKTRLALARAIRDEGIPISFQH